MATLHELIPRIQRTSVHLGLSLNVGKCNLLHVGTPSAEYLSGVPRVPVSSGCLRVLGAPIGAPAACLKWAREKVMLPWHRALDRLACLADPQAATLILRQCLSGCKVSWLLRTASSDVASPLAAACEDPLRASLGVILGTAMSTSHWDLATLPVRFGGLGVQNPIDYWEGASVASWLTAVRRAPDSFPHGVPVHLGVVAMSLASKFPTFGQPLMEHLLPWSPTELFAHSLSRKWSDQKAWSEEAW